MRAGGAMKTLLVGIGVELRAIVANGLSARGHEQIVSEDGVRALEALRHHAPALVVVEDPLADMTATEFCRQTRACPAGADTVILVIANHHDELSAVLEAGATDLYTTSLGTAALE